MKKNCFEFSKIAICFIIYALVLNIEVCAQVKNQMAKHQDVTPNGVEAVDLGLSVKWASCNVGATAPEEYGDYYAWGAIVPDNYGEKYYFDYLDSDKGIMKTYHFKDERHNSMGKTVITKDSGHDVAYEKWGCDWHLPSNEEFYELVNECSWSYTKKNGVAGFQVVGKNGNSIFLPAAGRKKSSLDGVGDGVMYWSRNLNRDSESADCLGVHCSDNDIEVKIGSRFRKDCFVIRPVIDVEDRITKKYNMKETNLTINGEKIYAEKDGGNLYHFSGKPQYVDIRYSADREYAHISEVVIFERNVFHYKYKMTSGNVSVDYYIGNGGTFGNIKLENVIFEKNKDTDEDESSVPENLRNIIINGNISFKYTDDYRKMLFPLPIDTICETPDVKPMFPGGISAYKEFFQKTYKYPAFAIESGIEGKVRIQFTVSKTGELSDFEIIEHADPSLEKAAMKIVQALPAFEPAQKDGNPVMSKCSITIPFLLE